MKSVNTHLAFAIMSTKGYEERLSDSLHGTKVLIQQHLQVQMISVLILEAQSRRHSGFSSYYSPLI